jgi:murein L,D-transpeptidase YcbB/YkuD
VAAADDPVEALASYNPRHPEFAALREQLATLRATARQPLPIMPVGPVLKIGSNGDRVAILRQRLNVTEPTESPLLFDAAIDVAVKAYQESKGLTVDGIVGNGTIARLNADAVDPVATIIANMERWRWMPEDLGNFFVRVNVPNYNLDVYRDDAVIHTTRIIVGEPKNPTPIFSDEIEYVIVNPVWHVPESIAIKEMLPEIRANPYRALAGYQVFFDANGTTYQVDPYRVDWWRVDMNRIHIKQPPGEANALGSVKFMFPNRFSVYLHDTPTKDLFSRDYRAYSHGCMRVMDPWEFAEVLLSAERSFTVDELRAMVGGRETQVNLTNHVRVHVTYFTAWVDDAGVLQLRDDIYGLDAAMENALGVQG